ncbi:hypothetical protein GLOIN_2v1783590 [Rhizophagus clarus]|uniref:Crinkler effector protein N-terminal domain-containing protein n=1 Tax=Rhizophagus clarus TaxID=94130 RepID=A0A8H3QDS2_9GLOM|nr:hypothetical protein GLOIN_2v1783590 [Rhizophagus clarus]
MSIGRREPEKLMEFYLIILMEFYLIEYLSWGLKWEEKELNLSQNNSICWQANLDLTPESIVKFLMKQEGVKADFRKPHKLCVNRCKFERKGREESFHKAYDSILIQYLNVQRAIKENLDLNDRLYYPLFALQSAPGGGKTFFIDEFASFKNDDFDSYLQKKPDAELIINELRNSVAICISYNGSSSYNPNIDGDGGEMGLVMRIIWSYFFDGTKLPWNFFYNQFKGKFCSLDILTAIESIIHHSGKSVLLCVDEIMKIGPPNIINLLASLYVPYQSFAVKDKRFRFIVSTLDAVRLWDIQTSSGRDINWIPLRRLELSESIDLFSKLIEKLGPDRPDRAFIIKKCISDCNGHPRTLESLYELLSKNNTALETYNFATIIEVLTKEIRPWYGDITFSIVKLALLGEPVDLKRKVEVKDKELSVKDLITSGIYINSVTEDTTNLKVIPTLSLVSLYYFSMTNDEDGNAKTVAKMLKDIFLVEDYFDLKSNDGKTFEMFHMRWELLYRALHHKDGMEMDLHEIYGLPSRKGIKIGIQRKNIVELQKDIEFPQNGEIRDRKGNIIKDLEKYVFIPTKLTNNGFEMVMFEKKTEGGYIAINVECKFSYPDSVSKLSSDKIRKKYKSVRTKYFSHVKSDSETIIGELGMTIDDIYLVMVTWRDMGKLDDDIMNNKNIIIVEKKNLEVIYSPSLVSRLQFYSEIRKKIENEKSKTYEKCEASEKSKTSDTSEASESNNPQTSFRRCCFEMETFKIKNYVCDMKLAIKLFYSSLRKGNCEILLVAVSSAGYLSELIKNPTLFTIRIIFSRLVVDNDF